jgi:hypothetical protein
LESTPPPRSDAVRAVDMSSSNAWPEFAAQSPKLTMYKHPGETT